MKYPNWNELSREKKQKAVEHELSLVTHNGTTKDDLVNIMRFLAEEVARLRKIEDVARGHVICCDEVFDDKCVSGCGYYTLCVALQALKGGALHGKP